MHSVNTVDRQILNSLTEEQQARLFVIVRDNAELFNKVMPNLPLIKLILNGGVESATSQIVDIYNKVHSQG